MAVRGSFTELTLELQISMFALVRVRAEDFGRNVEGHQVFFAVNGDVKHHARKFLQQMPPLRAQGTLWKRKQKEYKSERGRPQGSKAV